MGEVGKFFVPKRRDLLRQGATQVGVGGSHVDRARRDASFGVICEKIGCELAEILIF